METNQNSVPPTSGGSSAPSGFMATLEYYLVTKAPFQLPTSVKEFIVKFGPWIDLLFLLTFIPLIFALIGFGAFFSAYSMGYYAGGWSIYSILSLIAFVLGVIALPGLFGRKLVGWNFLFYSQIIYFVQSIISGNLIGGLIGVIIGFYFLFQIKSYYH